MTEQFGWERAALSGAFSIGSVVTGILALVSGRLTDKSGPKIFVIAAGILLGAGFLLMSQVSQLWQAYLAWGILVSGGIGCSGNAMGSSIPRWFTKNRGLAISVTIAGFNFGAVIGPIIIQSLISAIGWQHAFLVIGAIPILVNIPLSFFIKKDPETIGIKKFGEEEPAEEVSTIKLPGQEHPLADIMKTPIFWIFAMTQFAFGFCMQIIVIHIAPHATDIGIPALIAASILSIAAGSRIIGNLGAGFLAEWLGSRKVMVGCFVLMTAGLVWLLFAKNAAGLFIFSIIFGATTGGLNPLFTLVPAEMFGLRDIGIILGIFMVFGTTGGAIGSPLAGYIFDVSGNYETAFIISILIGVIATILSVIVLRDKTRVETG
jgi:MFS family permease